VAILGSTYDGAYEPVAEIAAALDALAPEAALTCQCTWTGVRRAGGPFSRPQAPLGLPRPRVQSINVSGHKYGLVYPGVGWILWRDAEALPDDLVFKVNYLGGEMPTFR